MVIWRNMSRYVELGNGPSSPAPDHGLLSGFFPRLCRGGIGQAWYAAREVVVPSKGVHSSFFSMGCAEVVLT